MRKSKQELCVGIVLIWRGRSTTVQRRYLSVEVEQSARSPVAELGLIVIQVKAHHVEPESHIVRALRPAHAVTVGIIFVRSEQRHPVGDAKLRVIAAESNIWKSALID